ncbi:MAG TPA: hypothetical protein VEC06_01700 [Paucimonas sp.]|nr:hypothetical protein [Paucimonas sp.]
MPPLCASPAAAAGAVNDALDKFLVAPSVSNRVAAVVALQAYFAQIEQRAGREADGD